MRVLKDPSAQNQLSLGPRERESDAIAVFPLFSQLFFWVNFVVEKVHVSTASVNNDLRLTGSVMKLLSRKS